MPTKATTTKAPVKKVTPKSTPAKAVLKKLTPVKPKVLKKVLPIVESKVLIELPVILKPIVAEDPVIVLPLVDPDQDSNSDLDDTIELVNIDLATYYQFIAIQNSETKNILGHILSDGLITLNKAFLINSILNKLGETISSFYSTTYTVNTYLSTLYVSYTKQGVADKIKNRLNMDGYNAISNL